MDHLVMFLVTLFVCVMNSGFRMSTGCTLYECVLPKDLYSKSSNYVEAAICVTVLNGVAGLVSFIYFSVYVHPMVFVGFAPFITVLIFKRFKIRLVEPMRLRLKEWVLKDADTKSV